MIRVFKDKWVWAFLILGLSTLLTAMNAADAAKKSLAVLTWVRSRMESVEDKADFSTEDRVEIHGRLDRIDARLKRLEAKK